MKVTRDIPGKRLTIEREAPRIPPAAPSLVLLALCSPFILHTIWTAPAAFVEGAEDGQKIALVAMAVFWSSIIFFTVRSMLARARWPTGIDADRIGGELRLREARLLGGLGAEEIIPLDRLTGMNVRRTSRAPSNHDPLRPVKDGPGIAFAFTVRSASGSSVKTHEMHVGVEHVDRVEEVTDLALRLGSAAGLSYFRVVRSDARDMEIDLRRESESGFGSVPSNLGVADYAKDAVSERAQSIARSETIAAFDANSFRSDHKFKVWNPGTEIRLRKPLSFAAVGCLPFTLLVFAGPVSYFFVRTVAKDGTQTTGSIPVAIFLGLFGLIFGAIAMVAVSSALPRTVIVTWASRSIQLRTLTKRREVSFDAIQEVELKQLQHYSGGKNPRTYYWCEVGVRLRDTSGGGGLTYEPVVETERLVDDPDTAYRMALPLATELARALKVPRRVSEPV